jgi:hypothetical protein
MTHCQLYLKILQSWQIDGSNDSLPAVSGSSGIYAALGNIIAAK